MILIIVIRLHFFLFLISFNSWQRNGFHKNANSIILKCISKIGKMFQEMIMSDDDAAAAG